MRSKENPNKKKIMVENYQIPMTFHRNTMKTSSKDLELKKNERKKTDDTTKFSSNF